MLDIAYRRADTVSHTTRETTMTLKQIAHAIAANAAAARPGCDWNAFSTEARRLWDLVSRGEPRIAGTACDRRHVRVHRYLAQIPC